MRGEEMWEGCRKSGGKIGLEWRGLCRREGQYHRGKSEGEEGECGSVSGRPCLARVEGRQRGKIKPFSFYDVICHDVLSTKIPVPLGRYSQPHTQYSCYSVPPSRSFRYSSCRCVLAQPSLCILPVRAP